MKNPPDHNGPTDLVERTSLPAPLAVIIKVHGAVAHPPSFRLAGGSIVVGAGPSADVVIESTTVSRIHLELTLVSEGVRVQDRGSRNGTFYLGQRVETMILSPSCRLTVGSTELSIEADPSALEGGGGLGEYRGMFAAAAAMQRVFSTLARLEGSLVSVFLLGESGVGKELIARALHAGSSVAAGPFVAKNCGAMTRELVQSELFGHRRGAFTGAIESRVGAFETADGGTLFLDEVAELPLDVQPLLLRVLETREFSPVGSNEVKKTKVRVIAATNRAIQDEIRGGRFREDLFYRLAVVKLEVPPLRERPEDVPLLASHFACAVGAAELPADLLGRFAAHSWPGNVRELKNAVEAYLALGVVPEFSKPAVDLFGMALRSALDLDQPFNEQKQAIVDRFTAIYLELLLERTQSNQSEAARLSGIERSHLRRMLTRYGLLPD